MQKTLIIPGDPVAQKRPRFSRKLGRAYNSQRETQDCLTWKIASQWGSEPIEGPVSLEIDFYIKIPKSTSKKRTEAMFATPCLKHSDVDNFLKMFLDASNGVIFKDDSQVWEATVRKVWSTDPRTEVVVNY